MELDKIKSLLLIKSQHFSQYIGKLSCMFALNFFKKLFINLLICPDSMKYHFKDCLSETEHIINILNSFYVHFCVIEFLLNSGRSIHRSSRNKFAGILILTNRITEITKLIYLPSIFFIFDKNVFRF